MTSYLLDTDIAIELLHGRNVHVAERLSSKNREQIFLSTHQLGSHASLRSHQMMCYLGDALDIQGKRPSVDGHMASFDTARAILL